MEQSLNKSGLNQAYQIGETLQFGNYDWIILDVKEDTVLIMTTVVECVLHCG